jgi:hypothetical protein
MKIARALAVQIHGFDLRAMEPGGEAIRNRVGEILKSFEPAHRQKYEVREREKQARRKRDSALGQPLSKYPWVP